jgi:hypothetical protein
MMAGKLSFVICNTRYVSILLLLQHDTISGSVGTRHKAARENRVGYCSADPLLQRWFTMFVDKNVCRSRILYYLYTEVVQYPKH